MAKREWVVSALQRIGGFSQAESLVTPVIPCRWASLRLFQHPLSSFIQLVIQAQLLRSAEALCMAQHQMLHQNAHSLSLRLTAFQSSSFTILSLSTFHWLDPKIAATIRLSDAALGLGQHV